jgi:hypothetical protein
MRELVKEITERGKEFGGHEDLAKETYMEPDGFDVSQVSRAALAMKQRA